MDYNNFENSPNSSNSISQFNPINSNSDYYNENSNSQYNNYENSSNYNPDNPNESSSPNQYPPYQYSYQPTCPADYEYIIEELHQKNQKLQKLVDEGSSLCSQMMSGIEKFQKQENQLLEEINELKRQLEEKEDPRDLKEEIRMLEKKFLAREHVCLHSDPSIQEHFNCMVSLREELRVAETKIERRDSAIEDSYLICQNLYNIIADLEATNQHPSPHHPPLPHPSEPIFIEMCPRALEEFIPPISASKVEVSSPTILIIPSPLPPSTKPGILPTPDPAYKLKYPWRGWPPKPFWSGRGWR